MPQSNLFNTDTVYWFSFLLIVKDWFGVLLSFLTYLRRGAEKQCHRQTEGSRTSIGIYGAPAVCHSFSMCYRLLYLLG